MPSSPRCQHLRVLGEGGQGQVSAEQDNDIGRPVAIKRLRSEQTSAPAVARFADEVRTVGRLEHPGIVPLHDVGPDEQGYYLVMKYLDGESREGIIDRLAAGDAQYHRRFDFTERACIFRELLDAVAFAHMVTAVGVLLWP